MRLVHDLQNASRAAGKSFVASLFLSLASSTCYWCRDRHSVMVNRLSIPTLEDIDGVK